MRRISQGTSVLLAILTLAIASCVTVVVLLPGRGFGTQHPSGRVSLANLNESDYRKIGRAVRTLLTEYVDRYNAATGKKLDRNKVS